MWTIAYDLQKITAVAHDFLDSQLGLGLGKANKVESGR